MMFRSLLIVILTVLLTSLSAQVSWEASLDADKILEGKRVELRFTLHNAEGSNFKPPAFNGIQVLGGPSTSSNMQIVNGRKSSSQSFVYSIAATQPGKYTINSAQITVNGQQLKTQPISLQVIKADPRSKNNPEIKVSIEASDTTVYVGQQVVLEYKVYTKVNIRQYNIYNESEYDGFFVQQMNVPHQFERTIINGDEYYVKAIKKIALFPQQAGSYEIRDVNFSLGVSTGRSRGFFETLDTRTMQASGFTIKVLPVPSQAPETFSGAVGKYQLTIQTDKSTLTTDDVIRLTMNVSGDGDNRLIQAPKIPLTEDLEMYDPNTTRDDVTARSDKLVHTKTFEYLIVPSKPGRYQINPDFTYFDVDSNAYVTIAGRPLVYRVARGSGINNQVVETNQEVTVGPLVASTSFRKLRRMFFGSRGYFIMLGLLGAMFCGMYGYRQHLIKTGAFDQLVQRKKKAKLKVIRDLQDQLKTSSSDKEKAEIISKQFNAYIARKFADSDRQYTDDEIIKVLNSSFIKESETERANKLLSRCQMAIYAGVLGSDIQQLEGEAVALIEDIDNQISMANAG